ncbi:hypothetical protein CDL15_Pgr003349 [Punica granatum]|uniref:RRM domain-containing protein n=1 Tax=Punica granatum TaxID=22663 RepID=A0A218X2Y1_PUNGR|nr:hypothetical protein CDL15_Pgr003349 [Punica granatum]PKI71360.1 hypothetical protein CRG98_008219 [Punica granatum]
MDIPSVVNTVTLRISSLPLEITKDVLVEHFDGYSVSNPVIIRHPEQTEFPYAFLRFHDPSQAERALQEENHVILGQRVNLVRVDPTLPPPPPEAQPNSRKIFIGGLPPTITVEFLRAYFERYGEILDCFIPLDHQTGRSKRFGFVEFHSAESINEILNGTQSRLYELGGGYVEVKSAIPKEVINSYGCRPLALATIPVIYRGHY